MPAHRILFFRILLILCVVGPASLPAAAAISPGKYAVAEVTDRIEAKDCAGAVAALKTGLKHAYPEVVLLAATLYDHGVCVQRDWNRAVLLYSQAWQGGEKEAADRLAAGFAAPENGADVAAALWWVNRGRLQAAPGGQALAACEASPAAAADVDRFVVELQTWPQARLAMCNYVAGVMATLSSEMKYPELARTHGVGGDVTLRFVPAAPRIELRKGDTREYQLVGVFNSGQVRDHEFARMSSQVNGSFEQQLAKVAERALRRYPKPEGIAPDAEFSVRYVFVLE
jgi:hypothetical protein